jgi:predicted nucleotidyltransferase component of viral defense system
MVVREWWEIRLLKGLFESALGDQLAFKGGTALRLTYGSPRFSDDLDFSQLSRFPFRPFADIVKDLAEQAPEMTLTDLAAKYYTFLAEFRIRDAALPRAFRIVVEVSRRATTITTELKLITSPCLPLTVLGRVATLESIWQEKLQALASRGSPRDLFDLWFLAQKLKRSLPEPEPRIDPRILRRDLRKYLPPSYYPVVEELARR